MGNTRARRAFILGFLFLVALAITSCEGSEKVGEGISTTIDRSTTTTERATSTTEDSATTTTEADRTTTTADRTTTTQAPTTTTQVDRTTIVVAVPTTTQSTTTQPTTTTTTAISTDETSSSNSDNTPLWILAIVLGVIGCLIWAAYIWQRNRNSQSAAESAWHQRAAQLVDSAQLTRDLLLDGAAGEMQRERVSSRVQMVASNADNAASIAPDQETAQASVNLAQALRNLEFTIEAEQLLRQARTPPTAGQLANADKTRRMRIIDLNNAVEHLASEVSTHNGNE